MLENNITAEAVAEQKTDKHLNSGVIEFGKEYFPSSIETKNSNEYSSYNSIYGNFDDLESDRNYLSYSKKKSSGLYAEDGYENYEHSPEFESYREAYPDQGLPEIDPAELWAYWHEKEESQ